MSQDHVSQHGELVLVAIGSNATSFAGGPRETVAEALEILQHTFNVYDDFSASPLYSTPAFPAGSGPDFVNAACCFSMMRAPQGLLEDLHGVEETFGRERTHRWGQRTLDLDLIAVGQTIAPNPATQTRWRTLPLDAQKSDTPDQLILPHPRVQDRAFVLVPLADIAPDWVHPQTGDSVTDMLAKCSEEDRRDVVAIP